MPREQDAGAPLVTVAILAHDRRDELAVTLERVQELAYPPDRLEVVVVDNASTDGTAEMVRARFPDVRLLRTERNEGVPAWNRAFAVGRGEWFLVLDDDCHLERDGLGRALAAAERARADLVSFRVESAEPGRSFTDAYRPGFLTFWGCAALVRARALREIGGFDPHIFLFNHELDFALRLLDRGMSHLVLPEVAAFHRKPLPPWREETYVRNLRNFAYVAVKSLRAPDAAIAVGNLLLRAGLDALGRRRVPPSLGAVLGGVRAGLRARRPARAPVSRLYRRHYVEWANPLELARAAPADPQQAFWDARPELYGRSSGTALRVPQRRGTRAPA